MSEQSAFDFDKQARLRAQAADWITANPQAFALFERFALRMAEKEKKFGIKGLVEFVRWHIAMEWEKDAAGFKINNNLPSYLARELVARHPELAAFVELRRCRDERTGEPILEVVKEQT